MDHDEKVAHYTKAMTEAGIAESNIAPPIYKLLWRSGVRVPPPLFAGFLQLMLIYGTFFGALWGFIMWVVMWRNKPILFSLVGAVAAAVLFGFFMALYMRWTAAKLNLPAWKDYPHPEG